MDNKKGPKKVQNFQCLFCDFDTCKKSKYSRHLETKKHKWITMDNKKGPKGPPIKSFICLCGKKYVHHSGLCKHQKLCEHTNISNNNNALEKQTEDKLTNAVIQLVQQNQDFQQIIMEQNKKIMELSKNTGIVINNTTNQKFNLNFFLNEQCKDAINIMDFVHSLCLQLTDLELVAKIGFVDGISQIFVNGLKELDIYKRPIHCSDFKREILYIKDEDKWEKENVEKDIMTKAIKTIAHKNVKQIPTWMKENPNCKDVNSQKNNEYLHLVSNNMSGSSQKEEIDNVKCIIKNIAKEVVIDK